MLDALGLSSTDDLYRHIPSQVLLDRPLDIPDGVSEMELLADLSALAARNGHADDLVCFAGGGAYDHYVPAAVWALAGRSELQTSYTPYQPELSQGVLQALFEYQSMICDLTGLEVSNASLYDGATAVVEAVNLARAATGRNRVLVADTVDPRYIEALRTYGRGAGYEPELLPSRGGRAVVPVMGEVACVVLQHPNAYGVLERARDVFAAARAAGARSIQVFDPLSLGVLAPPGELGVDIAVAEGQVLGNHLAYGGPYLGVIAAAVYLAWLGPAGLVEVGEACSAKAAYAAEGLRGVPGVRLAHAEAPFFKEFAVAFDGRSPAEVRDRLADRGYLVGPVLGDALVIACTERRTRDQIDGLAAAMREMLA